MSIMKVVRSHSLRSGAASLIVTVILTLSIITIVSTLTVIALKDTRQSGDLDQSSRALNAAQAGAQDLVNKINLNPDFTQTQCNGNTTVSQSEVDISDPNSTQDIAITCATVKNAGTSPGGFLPRDQGVVFDLSKAHGVTNKDNPEPPLASYDNVAFMLLRWNDMHTDATGNYYPWENGPPPNPPEATIDFPTLLTPKVAADRAEPASVELTFSWCPRRNSTDKSNPAYSECSYSASFLTANGGGEPTFTTVVRPSTRNYKDAATSDCISDPTVLTNLSCQIPHHILGTGSSGCSLNAKCPVPLDLTELLPIPTFISGNKKHNLDEIAKYIIKVRVKPRYAGMHYNVVFSDNNYTTQPDGSISIDPYPVYFGWPFSHIDVTARSGEVYRRVQGARYTSFSNYGFLDNALFSGKNICKNLIRYTGAGGPAGQKNTCIEP